MKPSQSKEVKYRLYQKPVVGDEVKIICGKVGNGTYYNMCKGFIGIIESVTICNSKVNEKQHVQRVRVRFPHINDYWFFTEKDFINITAENCERNIELIKGL